MTTISPAASKHMARRKARELGDERQLDRMGGDVREEAACGQHEIGDGAFQPVGGDGVLHEAPDALGRVVAMGGVGRQPQGHDTRMGGEPAVESTTLAVWAGAPSKAR